MANVGVRLTLTARTKEREKTKFKEALIRFRETKLERELFYPVNYAKYLSQDQKYSCRGKNGDQ